MSPTLSHYSRKPIEALRDGDVSTERGAYKPTGFWLSVDGDQDWREWCQGESFGCGENLLHYRAHLAPGANILVLSKPHEVHLFTERYGHAQRYLQGRLAIDWPAVARKHDGLIIAPYQWDCRLDNRCHWYYGWDCASGVIWKARAIASIELLGETTFVGRAYETGEGA